MLYANETRIQLVASIHGSLTLIRFKVGKVPYEFANEPATSAQNIECFEVFREQFSLILFGPNERRHL